jgi:hypothetical protein
MTELQLYLLVAPLVLLVVVGGGGLLLAHILERQHPRAR